MEVHGHRIRNPLFSYGCSHCSLFCLFWLTVKFFVLKSKVVGATSSEGFSSGRCNDVSDCAILLLGCIRTLSKWGLLLQKVYSVMVCSICLTVGLSVTTVSPAKTAESNRNAVWNADSRNYVLDGDQIPCGKGFLQAGALYIVREVLKEMVDTMSWVGLVVSIARMV